MSTSTLNIGSLIQDAVKQNAAVAANGESSPDYAAEYAALAAENARLKASSTPIRATNPGISGTSSQIRSTIVDSKALSNLVGTYPETATPQDRMILDAIHQLKSKARDNAKPGEVPACFGKALYSFFHACGVTTEKLNPYIDSSVKRGIVTRFVAGKYMLYFDAREVAPKTMPGDSKAPSATVKATVSALFV